MIRRLRDRFTGTWQIPLELCVHTYEPAPLAYKARRYVEALHVRVVTSIAPVMVTA